LVEKALLGSSTERIALLISRLLNTVSAAHLPRKALLSHSM